MKHILIIEDDKLLSNGICLALKNSTLQIEQCFDLKTSRQKTAETPFDLIILDINLPDGNGLDFLRELKQTQNTPVILLTANDMELDIVTGLETGAEDYITKPFSLAVFRARVNTQLRKPPHFISNKYKMNDFIFDFDKMEFYHHSISIELSKTEQKLLKILLENKGITLQRAVLVDRIWTDSAEYVDENALSVTIKRLRDKLETTPASPEYIKTVYGIGYTWAVSQTSL